MKFPGYVKAGDALTLTFESAVKTLRQIDVTTWLDKADNPVLFTLSIPESKIEVRITKSNYQKVVQ